MRGRGDLHVEGGLEVGLVEAGEHALGVGRLELRVEVDLVVDGVDEAVQALTCVRVQAVRVDHQDVVFGQAGQRDAGGFVVSGHIQGVAVECRAVDRVGRQVDEGVGTGKCVECHGRGGPEGAVAQACRCRR